MNKQKQYFWEVIEIFSLAGLLPYVVLIGSWAEYIYEVTNYFNNFQSNLRTRDADFLIKNINKPNEKILLHKLFSQNGFEPQIDVLTGVTKFTKGGAIEVEFIVNEMGKGQTEPYYVKPFGIKAEGLRHMGIILENLIELRYDVLCINRGSTDSVESKRYIMQVPSPQAYILHKLIINDKRGVKQEKDKMSAFNLMDKIHESSEEMEKLMNLYLSLHKNDKNKVDDICKENYRKLFPSHY